jgi:RNA polymerase sigma-70 factor (ECF subfamily)
MREGFPLFPSTNWRDIASIQNRDDEAQGALERLCKAYWFPIYAFIRKQNPSPDSARDLTQAFFAQLLEKDSLASIEREGHRFRNFLLTACRNFLTEAHSHANREPPSPNHGWIPLNIVTIEERYAASVFTLDSPERCFERQWALTTIDRSFEAVESEYRLRQKEPLFKYLQRFLDEDPEALSHRNTAEQLGMTEPAVRTELHRLRQRLREALKNEISATVTRSNETDSELSILLSALGA